MGILTAIGSGPVYLDANIFIYWLDGHPQFRPPLLDVFRALDNGQLRAVTSEITLAEVLVKPFVDQNAARQRAYQDLLNPGGPITIAPVSRGILIASARIRATARLPLPDAIHAATAQQSQRPARLARESRPLLSHG